ncbi:MAG: type II toxin-antitoxin system Phd/YefM family antitoxin [Planctomycetaceae bacterium]|nr:type II toxin-antitoxin system Phd/YefM family antitoxin [Planctomycetaceae bacterium]
MNTISMESAQTRLPEILSEISRTHIPVRINDEFHTGVFVSADDWRSIQETLYLLSVPGMRESIREGLQTPLAECSKSVWSEENR